MLKNIFKHYLYPIATISGSIIGVGFLSLPYITVKVGLVPMFFYFVILSALVTFIHLIFTQVCLATPDFKRWPGFVRFYFGPWAGRLIFIPMILGGFAVLLVYLIIGSQFLFTILSPILGGSLIVYVLLYFLVIITIVYFGINLVSRVEFWGVTSLIIVLAVIFFKGFDHIDLANITAAIIVPGLDWKTMFLPFGALVFAFWGTMLIPEAEEMVRGRKQTLKTIITLGTLLPAVVYLVFILLIVSITGANTTESALIGLKEFLGLRVLSVALLIGIVGTFTASLAEGLLLKKVFMYDLGIKHFPAWVFTCFPGLIIFLLGLNAFIPIVSFIGGVFLSIDGILILLMYVKIGGRKLIIYPLVLFFMLGLAYQIIYFLN